MGSWVQTAKHYRIVEGTTPPVLFAELYKPDGTTNPTCIAIYPGMEYHNINGEFCVGNVQRTLFVCLGNQLGNCLRILTSSMIIADYFGLHLFIDYDFPGLINKEKIIIKELFPHLCLSGCSHLYEKIDYTDCVTYENYNHTNYDLIDEGRLLELPNSNNFSIVQTIYSVLPGTMSYTEYNRAKINIYNSIVFPPFLLKDVDDFLRIYRNPQNIGVHIRHTDNLNDTNKQRYNTSKEIFIEKMKQYNHETIFLCSDNGNILTECRDLFPNIIVSPPCSNPLYQALFEMILLSKTKRIVGSDSSTFSYESAYFSGTDIELYQNSEWTLYKVAVVVEL
jgi:hypothetical protein